MRKDSYRFKISQSYTQVFSQYHFSQSTAPGVCEVQTFTRWTYQPENGWSYCQATRIIRSHCPHCQCGGQEVHHSEV
ncbi:unnamed protein product [Calicophoron daubneyi]|uniref:Uncharacterized protein n=1 Tax=Calicophoron daubneyi TaxID=300641 RepID=A0AAV2U163_CALDB